MKKASIKQPYLKKSDHPLLNKKELSFFFSSGVPSYQYYNKKQNKRTQAFNATFIIIVYFKYLRTNTLYLP